jgi:hypothetical protein
MLLICEFSEWQRVRNIRLFDFADAESLVFVSTPHRGIASNTAQLAPPQTAAQLHRPVEAAPVHPSAVHNIRILFDVSGNVLVARVISQQLVLGWLTVALGNRNGLSEVHKSYAPVPRKE